MGIPYDTFESIGSTACPRSLPPMKIRPASAVDLDAITALGLAALKDDPIWPYRFPFAGEYPDEHYKYSRQRFSEYLDNVATGACTIMLAESPSVEDPDTKKIVAMSIWQMQGTHLRRKNSTSAERKGLLSRDAQVVVMKPPADNYDRPDASPARLRAFREGLSKARRELFNEKYGDRQLSLLILATHPDYRQRGAAAMLCKWGLSKALEEGVAVTLFSSPMGRPLYTKLGFKEVGMVHTQVAGESEALDTPAMVFELPN